MANVQIGKWLYNTMDIPFTAKVLGVMTKRKNGVAIPTIAEQKEIINDFNGDNFRAMNRVNNVLSTLKLRGVVNSLQKDDGNVVWKVIDNNCALTLITEGGKLTSSMTQRVAATANIQDKAAVSSDNNTKKKDTKTMTTKTATKKAPRLFINPETNTVQPFGAGRPSKAKIALECNAEGKYLDAVAAAAFLQNGGKSEDKLTKTELLDLLRKVRAERDAALAAVEIMKAASVEAEQAETENDEDVEDDDNLDVEAEQVDADEDDETLSA